MGIERLFWTGYLSWHVLGQARYAFRPLPAIRRDQVRRVRRIVAHAFRHVPYYGETLRHLGLTPDDFRSAADLAKLPLLRREQLQEDPERFISRAHPRQDLFAIRTSGSTGAPRTICYDLPALFQCAAHTERERAVLWPLVGRRFGYRETHFGPRHSATQAIRGLCHRKAWFPRATRIERQALCVVDPVGGNLAAFNTFRPDVVYTYGSYLTLLFAHVHSRGVHIHCPKAILYSSDSLPPRVRRLITDDYGIPVFSWYQSSEALKIAFECERHTGLHVHEDTCPVRIADADGSSVPAGEVGRVVISNLVNRGTVLLNYDLGDRAALLPESCPCGRSLPLLSDPVARSDDLLVLPSGRLAHPVAVQAVLELRGDVWEYQIVQRSPTHLDIRVVARAGCAREQLAEALARSLREVLGGDVTIDMRFVDRIARTPGGKLRSVVRACPAAAPGLAEEA